TDAFAADGSFTTAVRRNWRLYAPLAAGAVVGVFAAFQVLASSASAGFQMPGIQWYEYAFTQARVLLSYVTLFVLPVGLTPDHDVVLSRSLLDGGAGLAILLWVALVAVAVSLRRKYPVAVLGFLVFLVLLMPTSSVIPIKDLMAERRMYLPFVGLLLVALDWLSRVSVPNGTLAGISTCALAVFAVGTYHRAEAWGDSEKLWESAIAATPMKARPYGNLASVYLVQRQCAAALRVFDRAKEAKVKIEDATVLATWALSLECGGDLDAGIAKMQAAVETEPSAQAFASLGRMYLRAQRLTDAERALAEGERLNPAWETTHVYRAMLHTARNNEQQAIAELKRVLARNPANRHARELLEQTSERSRAYP
ncbi:MAG TPA: hypothetical protein VES20_14420, partial [Bryobacteraceae bacterium]|nr:hypothetical protein [Bryobacteraceae bacterium]